MDSSSFKEDRLQDFQALCAYLRWRKNMLNELEGLKYIFVSVSNLEKWRERCEVLLQRPVEESS
jgi:hypothetical protein